MSEIDIDKITRPKSNPQIVFLKFCGEETQKINGLKKWCRKNCEGYFCITDFRTKYIGPEPESPIQGEAVKPPEVDIPASHILLFEKQEDLTKFQLEFEG